MDRLGRIDLLRRDPIDRAAHRLDLENESDVVDLLELLDGQTEHRAAAVGVELDEALGCQIP